MGWNLRFSLIEVGMTCGHCCETATSVRIHSSFKAVGTYTKSGRQLAFSLPSVSDVDHGDAADEEDLGMDDAGQSAIRLCGPVSDSHNPRDERGVGIGSNEYHSSECAGDISAQHYPD